MASEVSYRCPFVGMDWYLGILAVPGICGLLGAGRDRSRSTGAMEIQFWVVKARQP